MRKTLAGLAFGVLLFLASPVQAAVCRVNLVDAISSGGGGYTLSIKGVFLGTSQAQPFAVLVTVLSGDTKAQVNAKILTALQAAATASGLSIVAADITPAP